VRHARAALASGVAIAASLGSAGCLSPTIAVQQGAVFQASKDPTQYRSPQPRDARAPGLTQRGHATAAGTACRTMLALPTAPPGIFYGSDSVIGLIPFGPWSVTWGDDGYAAALARARESAHASLLFDVRADVHTTAVLGIWRRECIEVHALVAR
jgi:hypothetical protein